VTEEAAVAAYWEAPVATLRGVGDKMAERLARLNIATVQDLLFHLPSRYQDRTRVTPLGALRVGDEALICGEVLLAEVRYGRRPALLVRINDGTGALTLRLFHFTMQQREQFTPGVWLQCFGEVRPGAATLEMVHPEYRRIAGREEAVAETHLTAVYPVTDGVRQATLRQLIARTVERLAAHDEQDALPDWLPAEARRDLPSLNEALLCIHRPPPRAEGGVLERARRRLAFEELLAHHLCLRRLRQRVARYHAPLLPPDGEQLRRFVRALPFDLTAAQRRVMGEIGADLARPMPMQRLVQGDVGSGKTVVAAAAVVQAVAAGFQAAVMAPTELLAEQHYHNFDRWLGELGITVAWLSGKHKGRTRQAIAGQVADGTVQVAIGTHALFQEAVSFAALGVVVIDEQHRFGVHQRMALREKGRRGGGVPHQLIMTATPIPRTLMMTAYADLDCSVIDELPPGRQPVDTVIVSDARREQVLERVRHAVREGRQAYWVCTLIEESEQLQAQAAADTAVALAAALPEVRVGLVHGRMKPVEKEGIMAEFKAGRTDLLVATTVIEVGVDVPNASLMIVENAERLGLAQLHQLRGRVGRGAAKSACVLLYHGPLSKRGRERLAALRDTADGFEIARRDLELRGPGEVLGTRQSGLMQLRVADLLRDQALLPSVGALARRMLEKEPQRVGSLVRRWVGSAAQYGAV